MAAHPPIPATRRARRSSSLLLAGVLIVTAAVHAPALLGAPVLDDEALLARNPLLHGVGQLAAVMQQPLWGAGEPFWRPLTALVLDVGDLAGPPWVLHAVSLLLHLAAVAVAFALVRRWTGAAVVAALVALLFGVHPAQVESVAWIAAINDPLWVLCAVLAMRSFLVWRDRGAAGWWWPGGVAFALALAAKETAVVLPLLIAALWLQQPTDRRATLRAALPLVAAAALWWCGRVLAFGDLAGGLDRGGADVELGAERAGVLHFEVLGRLVWHLVWPWQPRWLRDLPARLDAASIAAAVLGLTVLAVWGREVVRRVFGKSAAAPWRLAGWTLIVAPLLPITAAPLGAGPYAVYDRYLDLPVLGLAVLLVPALAGRRGGRILVVLLAIAMATRSVERTSFWSGPQTLSARLIEESPGSALSWFERGKNLLAAAQAGDDAALAAAQAAFRRARELLTAPTLAAPTIAHRIGADIEVALAQCMFLADDRAGRGAGAARAAFARLVDRHPEHVGARLGLGSAAAVQGDFTAARQAFESAVRLDPTNSEAHFDLGRLYLLTGQPAAAVRELEAAVDLSPNNRAAHSLLEEARRRAP